MTLLNIKISSEPSSLLFRFTHRALSTLYEKLAAIMGVSSHKEIDQAWQTTNATFRTGLTKDLAWRRWQLKQLWWMLEDNSERMAQCLKEDLNRHAFEAYFTDIEGPKKDIIEHLKHLDEWTATKPINAGFLLGTMGKARLRKEPLGTTLIIGAWNFPVSNMRALTSLSCVLVLPLCRLPRTPKSLTNAP